MIIDPHSMELLNKIHIQEMLEQARNDRLLKEIGVSNGGFAQSIVTRLSRWIHRTQRAATPSMGPKRITAEIPSL